MVSVKKLLPLPIHARGWFMDLSRSSSEHDELQRLTGSEVDSERRASGRRARLRDRLMDRGTQGPRENDGSLEARRIENLLLFIDDDLRETALSMERIETFLGKDLGHAGEPQGRARDGS